MKYPSGRKITTLIPFCILGVSTPWAFSSPVSTCLSGSECMKVSEDILLLGKSSKMQVDQFGICAIVFTNDNVAVDPPGSVVTIPTDSKTSWASFLYNTRSSLTMADWQADFASSYGGPRDSAPYFTLSQVGHLDCPPPGPPVNEALFATSLPAPAPPGSNAEISVSDPPPSLATIDTFNATSTTPAVSSPSLPAPPVTTVSVPAEVVPPPPDPAPSSTDITSADGGGDGGADGDGGDGSDGSN